MIIAIDFDGTCVTHEYPNVGKDIGAAPILKTLADSGHKLVLFTMRSHNRDKEPSCLQDAIDWFDDNDIKLWGVNINPEQSEWTSSPKAYAQLYIDDAALGCPLKQDYIEDENGLATDFKGRPYVDWQTVESWLKVNGLI